MEKSKTDCITARAAHEIATARTRSLRLKTLQDWGLVVDAKSWAQ
ncbi:MAG: hypothetical protein NZ729_05770 [Methylococcales bacterium]|nr:hypothetical protein [Methylococcales bacterium]